MSGNGSWGIERAGSAKVLPGTLGKCRSAARIRRRPSAGGALARSSGCYSQRRAIPLPLEKIIRKFEQGVYTVDVRWGMALDLPNGDNRSPIAFGSYAWENQQVNVERLTLGPGPQNPGVASGK
jgi:hypothetical protein